MALKQLNLKELNLIFLVFLFVFGRVFMGLELGSLRLGEIVIGLSSLYLCYEIAKNILKINNLGYFEKLLLIFLILVLIHFVFLILNYGYEFFNLYPFKVSSYIWVLGAYFIGKNYSNNFSTRKSLIIISIVLVINYYTSIFGISNSAQDLILNFTDKFDYLKASDLVIFFIFFAYNFIKSEFSDSRKFNMLFLLYCFFYLPLIMHKSRGASIAFVLFTFFILRLFLKKKYSLKFYSITLFLITLSFITSSFIVSKSPIQLSEIDDKVIYVSTGRYQKPLQNTPQNTDDYPVFYFENNRFYSSDGNFNWRLQIWQDVAFDLKNNNNLLIGYGYNEKIPAMNEIYRSGNDGTNENVHNHFINILARGGLIHLFLFLFFYFVIFLNEKRKNNLNLFFIIFIPAMLTSFFDASMENAHYPLIFYFLLGNLSNLKEN